MYDCIESYFLNENTHRNRTECSMLSASRASTSVLRWQTICSILRIDRLYEKLSINIIDFGIQDPISKLFQEDNVYNFKNSVEFEEVFCLFLYFYDDLIFFIEWSKQP